MTEPRPVWIELHDTLLDHRKVKRLSRAVTRQAVTVRGHLVTLWLNVLRHAPDGNLVDWEPEDIEDYAEWDGESGAFVQALVDCGFLKKGRDEAIEVNDWSEYATHIKAAERKRKERERKRFEAEDTVPESHDVTNCPVTSQDGSRNSGPVTLNRTEPEPNQNQNRTEPTNTKPGSALVVAGDRSLGKPIQPHDADAAAAYAHWREQHTRADPALDRKSRGYRHAVKQLQKGRTLADLRAAIDGCHASDWNRENHKDSFEFIMREDQFLAFMERGYAPNKPKGWVAQTQQFLDDQLDNLEAQHAG